MADVAKGKDVIAFFVPGIPAPGGSKRHVGNGILIDAAKNNKPWRSMVGEYAHKAMDGKAPSREPLSVITTFVMPRPKGHYRKDGTLRPNADKHHTKRPDALKLMRSTEDAMTGIVWADDSQVAEHLIRKEYGDTPGARIAVTEIKP